MAIVVRPSASRSSASCTSRSVWVSRAEVASSRTRIGGGRRGGRGGAAGRLLDLVVGRVRFGEAEVLTDGRVEEVRLLRDDPHRLRERGEGQLAHVLALDRDAAAAPVVADGGAK